MDTEASPRQRDTPGPAGERRGMALLRRAGDNAAAFGLPGRWRMSVQPPEAQQALLVALDARP